jgi:hypothetical protein
LDTTTFVRTLRALVDAEEAFLVSIEGVRAFDPVAYAEAVELHRLMPWVEPAVLSEAGRLRLTSNVVSLSRTRRSWVALPTQIGRPSGATSEIEGSGDPAAGVPGPRERQLRRRQTGIAGSAPSPERRLGPAAPAGRPHLLRLPVSPDEMTESCGLNDKILQTP